MPNMRFLVQAQDTFKEQHLSLSHEPGRQIQEIPLVFDRTTLALQFTQQSELFLSLMPAHAGK